MSDIEIYQKIINSEDEVVRICDATEREGEYSMPYKLGWKPIDDALKGGVREGDLVVITGKSGNGKTTLIQNIATNLSDFGYSCLFFSYEVIIDNLYAKFKEICGEGIKNLKVFTPKKNTSGNTSWVKKKMVEGIEKYGTKFVFIDDLDALEPNKKIGNSNEYRHLMGAAIRELKALAIELKIIIFLCVHVRKVQIGRAVVMEDLAEGGDGYKKADLLLCVARNVKVENIGGFKTEVFGEGSNLRTLKNRITGQHAIMEFSVDGSKIVPVSNEPEIRSYVDKDRDDDIIVDNLFNQ